MLDGSLFALRYDSRIKTLFKFFLRNNYLVDLFRNFLRFDIFLAFSVLFMLLFDNRSHK